MGDIFVPQNFQRGEVGIISVFDSGRHKHDLREYHIYNSNYVYETKEEKSNNKKFKTELFDWLDVITIAFAVVILLFSVFFRVATIEGNSMRNTFHNGEKVVISKLGYTPKYGDVVVISRNYLSEHNKTEHDSQPIIKRVIATENQTVSIDFEEGVVYVDNQPLSEPYTATPTNNTVDINQAKQLEKGVTVPKGCVFVLGDNRNDSLDSRSSAMGNLGNGMINEDFIIGKVFLRIFPFSAFGGIK